MNDYDLQARIEFNRQIRQVESAPLAERQEARKDWTEALQDPALIAERVSWLLDGNYGFGAHIAAQEVAGNKRMNRPAWMGITIAALEWNCPSNFARAAWNKITTAQQEAITAAIQAEINQFLADHAE